MQLVITACIVLLNSSSVIAVDPNDPNTIAAAEQEVVDQINQLPVKKEQMETKLYNGTFADIMAQRIADANDIIVLSNTIQDQSEKIYKAIKLDAEKKKVVEYVLQKYNSVKKVQKNQVLDKTIFDINKELSDPNQLPPESDPNYMPELKRRMEMMAAVIRITEYMRDVETD